MNLRLVRWYILMALFLSGCDKPDPVDPDVEVDFFDLSLTTIEFSANKDASLVVVNTDMHWDAACNADWVELSVWSGNKSTGFIIGAHPNQFMERQTMVTITAGDQEKQIAIQQAGVSQIEFTIHGVPFRFLPVKADTTFYLDGMTYIASREVYLDSYFISETEITQAQWQAVTGNLPPGNEPPYTRMPVVVNWNQINQEFLPALRQKQAYNFRLPTENEWEVAAKGGLQGNNTSFAGSMYIEEVAWFYQNSEGRKHAVATKHPNELGLYDMSGNVSEWCSDWYAEWTDSNPPPSPSTNPQGPANGTEKVIRGGDFLANRFEYDLNNCNISSRNALPPGISTENFLHEGYEHYTGFRLVISKNQ